MSFVPPLPRTRPARGQRAREAHAEKARVNRVDKEQRRCAKLKAREASRAEAVHSYGSVPLATVQTTAKYLGNISDKTVYRLIEDGKLEAVRIGARVMVKTPSAMKLAGV
jgi:excisionase family DNA binding protein